MQVTAASCDVHGRFGEDALGRSAPDSYPEPEVVCHNILMIPVAKYYRELLSPDADESLRCSEAETPQWRLKLRLKWLACL